MKPIYIIHPFKGANSNYSENLKKVTKIANNLKSHGYIPISPIHAFSYLDESKNPNDRILALQYCFSLMEMVHKEEGEAWVYGDWRNSEGCEKEILKATELGMRIRF